MTTAAALDFSHTGSVTVNPLFVRHDLMVEMARLEMKIEDEREHSHVERVPPLEKRLQKVAHVLSRIPA